jgi:hypothetical protein
VRCQVQWRRRKVRLHRKSQRITGAAHNRSRAIDICRGVSRGGVTYIGSSGGSVCCIGGHNRGERHRRMRHLRGTCLSLATSSALSAASTAAAATAATAAAFVTVRAAL